MSTAGTKRPEARYVIELPFGEKRTMTVPLVHDTGPGRIAALQVVKSCYPNAVSISPAVYVLAVDTRPDLDTPLPSRGSALGEGRG